MENFQKGLIGAHTVATAHIAGAFERMRSEKGQGAVEYAGMVLLVALVIAAAITLLSGDNFIGTAVKGKVSEAFGKLTG